MTIGINQKWHWFQLTWFLECTSSTQGQIGLFLRLFFHEVLYPFVFHKTFSIQIFLHLMHSFSAGIDPKWPFSRWKRSIVTRIDSKWQQSNNETIVIFFLIHFVKEGMHDMSTHAQKLFLIHLWDHSVQSITRFLMKSKVDKKWNSDEIKNGSKVDFCYN